LSPGEARLWERLESSGRQAIRKAGKNGVKVEISHSPEAMEAFFLLQCKTRKKHGLPPQPATFFSNIHQHIVAQDMGMVALARHEGIPIAGAVYFHLGGQAIYKYGASDERFQHLRGSNLVMWEAIKWYLQKGMKQLNLGRTSLTNEGLRRFKLGWGAAEKKIDYFKYDFQKQGFVGDDDRASGWHNRIFRSSPVFMSRMAGNLLYRHWA
jgi:lipid II:glycine glycyltransferase (peptidoglycan interpeptide bridge formation enzyme)